MHEINHAGSWQNLKYQFIHMTKMLILSGLCHPKGMRVQAVGPVEWEKIDIIEWSDDPAVFMPMLILLR